MNFFIGLHKPHHAQHFDRAFVSVNRLRERKGPFPARQWIMDSGAFTEVTRHGRYRSGPEEYVREIARWRSCGELLAAVTQDFMCEPFVLEITGGTVADHQRWTVERFDRIRELAEVDAPGVYILPVLQGWTPADYVAHLAMYGDRLGPGAWVGVGSVCKRNASVQSVEAILRAIKTARPDLRLHGFGLKITALGSSTVRDLLFSADSMAWSYNARMHGRNQNCWKEAAAFLAKIERRPLQVSLPLEAER